MSHFFNQRQLDSESLCSVKVMVATCLSIIGDVIVLLINVFFVLFWIFFGGAALGLFLSLLGCLFLSGCLGQFFFVRLVLLGCLCLCLRIKLCLLGLLLRLDALLLLFLLSLLLHHDLDCLILGTLRPCASSGSSFDIFLAIVLR